VYVVDIVITGNDAAKISQLKQHLFSHFQTKDLGYLKYFLDIEVAQSKVLSFHRENMIWTFWRRQV